jgi:antitoxin component YwqK of YwqJK toxin-antitoxin module
MRFLKIMFLFITLLALSCCKINQFKHKQKTGRWVYRDTVNGIVYESKGKYKKGLEKKTWNYYANNKLIKKEEYKKGLCYVTTYFDNGAIASAGKTKLSVTDAETHWYYFDEWHFYDETGKLIKIKKYAEGALLEETTIK